MAFFEIMYKDFSFSLFQYLEVVFVAMQKNTQELKWELWQY